MASNIYTAGLNNVGSYQVSGIPFATSSVDCKSPGSATKISFPYVTKWIYVINNSSNDVCKVGFSENGLALSNWFTVGKPAGAGERGNSQVLDLKITELWLTGSQDVDIVAGLTNLSTDRVLNASPSGSNWSGSSGVG